MENYLILLQISASVKELLQYGHILQTYKSINKRGRVRKWGKIGNNLA